MKNTTLALVMSALLGGVAAAQTSASGTGNPPATAGTGGTIAAGGSRTTAATAVAADYRLVAGDKLRIEVYKDPQLSQSLQIRPDGKITLPLLGDVPAAGLTPTALRDQLTNSLREYVTNPVVTVIVVEATPPTIYVMGEVKSPGPQPMRGQMTVLEALSMAGGFLDFAKTSDVRVLRKGPAGTETLKFNYKDAVKGEGEMIVLRPGDVVVVP